MKVGIIDPRDGARAELIETPSLADALKLVALESGQINHGTLTRDRDGGVAYVCDQFALFVPAHKQRFCSIRRQLIAGSAVLYAFDDRGDTVDLKEMPAVTFYANAERVELAIASHFIDRPNITVGGICRWTWPELEDSAGIIERMRDDGEI